MLCAPAARGIAPPPAAPAAHTASPVALAESPSTAEPYRAFARGHDTALRGPSGQIIFDSISGCTTFSRSGFAPAAILDDLSFAPGPAASSGAVVTGLDFYIRSWGPQPSIIVRLTFFDTIIFEGAGDPPVVQHEVVSQQFIPLENAPVNIGPPGSYFISAQLAPFVISDAEFGLEIAFVDDADQIIPNGTLSTVFPGNACADAQPTVGSSQEVYWIDNDFGNQTGDGIRYEPADPSMPANQGDALQWGGAMPADNVLAVRLRGFPIEPSIGACCMTEEPYACVQQSADDCAAAGGIFIGLGEPCTPVFLCVPPPTNDDCQDATSIAGEGLFPFDTRGASSIGPDDCRLGAPPFGISSDVWFRWTAPCTGIFELATCGQSLTDDRIAVYAPVCDAAVSYGCDDDACETNVQSWLSLSAAAGQTFHIRLGVHPNTPGGIGQLSITAASLPCLPGCPADFDGSGNVDVPDIFAFLSAWFTQDPRAWFFQGSPGGVPAIFSFLSAWFAQGQGPC
jgi:hypothetical protein